MLSQWSWNGYVDTIVTCKNKPFKVLVLLEVLVANEIDVAGKGFCDEISATSNLNLDEDLFPFIPNSSVESRSKESTVLRWDCCWVVCTYDGDVLI